MKEFKLFILWLRSSIKYMIKGLLFTAVLFAVYALFLFGTAVSDPAPLVCAGVVTEDERLYDFICSVTDDIPGVSLLCGFEKMDQDTARLAMEEGRIGMIIEIPRDFYSKVSGMQESVIRIVVPGQPSETVKKILSMLGSASSLIRITDAGILAMYDGIVRYDLPIDRHRMENDLLMKTYNGFLERDDMIKVRSVSAYGAYMPVEFYLTTLIMIIMVICSVSFFGIYDRESVMLEQMIIRGRMSCVKTSVLKIPAMTVALGMICEAAFVLLNLDFINAIFSSPDPARFHLCMWTVSLSVAVWIDLIANTSVRINSDFRVIYIVSALLLMCMSGVIVPAAYLPGMFRDTAGFFPTGALHSVMLSGMWDCSRLRAPGDINGLSVTLITDGIVLILAIWAKNRRRYN